MLKILFALPLGIAICFPSAPAAAYGNPKEKAPKANLILGNSAIKKSTYWFPSNEDANKLVPVHCRTRPTLQLGQFWYTAFICEPAYQ